MTTVRLDIEYDGSSFRGWARQPGQRTVQGVLEAALEQEFRVSSRCFAAPDLAEGIRAQVIDKDRDPKWSPSTLDQVGEDQVLAYFAGLDQFELRLPEGRENGQVAL